MLNKCTMREVDETLSLSPLMPLRKGWHYGVNTDAAPSRSVNCYTKPSAENSLINWKKSENEKQKANFNDC